MHILLDAWTSCNLSCRGWAVRLLKVEPTSLDLCQDKPQTGKKADVIKAAHLCAEAALRLVKPGNKVKLSRQDL